MDLMQEWPKVGAYKKTKNTKKQRIEKCIYNKTKNCKYKEYNKLRTKIQEIQRTKNPKYKEYNEQRIPKQGKQKPKQMWSTSAVFFRQCCGLCCFSLRAVHAVDFTARCTPCGLYCFGLPAATLWSLLL